MPEIVFIGLGSNLGDRAQNLRAAVTELGKLGALQAASPIYQTAPWGFTDQPAFLNQVVKLETRLPPPELLVELKNIERNMGRQESFRYGPRLIDLDILYYGDQVIHLPGLEIPHPQLPFRAFVLAPLADIAPHLLHPQLKQTTSQLLAQVDRSTVERLPVVENTIPHPER